MCVCLCVWLRGQGVCRVCDVMSVRSDTVFNVLVDQCAIDQVNNYARCLLRVYDCMW